MALIWTEKELQHDPVGSDDQGNTPGPGEFFSRKAQLLLPARGETSHAQAEEVDSDSLSLGASLKERYQLQSYITPRERQVIMDHMLFGRGGGYY
jgi:SpoVK/Ycf46/Vps4 family AAA+-type ATPase